MRRIMVCAAASLLAGCGTNDCEVLRQVVAPSSGTEPGTLQLGMLQSSDASQPPGTAVAARSDGSVVCLTCSGISMLDPGLHETDRVEVRGPDSVVVAPDDAIYAVLYPSSPGTATLVALSPAGEQRWKAPIASAWSPIHLAAGTQGPYVGATISTQDASLYRAMIFGFDAATGQPRTVATGQELLGAAHSGVFSFESQDGPSATLRYLDPDGHVMWSHVLSSTIRGLHLDGAAATADGGVVVFGTTPSTVDFGDRTLAVTGSPAGFVAGFDAAGAIQWAFTQDSLSVTNLAVTAQGEILLVDQALATYPTHDADARLSVATPAGIVRTLAFTGPELQVISGLAVTPDGLAWVQVYNAASDDNRPAPVMHIGDRTFADPGTYLFKLVP